MQCVRNRRHMERNQPSRNQLKYFKADQANSNTRLDCFSTWGSVAREKGRPHTTNRHQIFQGLDLQHDKIQALEISEIGRKHRHEGCSSILLLINI